MDTSAYLTSHGWLGTGHALNPTGRGLKRPLLVSRKSNTLGVGLRKHSAHADQWWAQVFDNRLKSLEVSNNEVTGDTSSVTAGVSGTLDFIKAGGVKWVGKGGLYAGFVKGESLEGTLKVEKERLHDQRSRAFDITSEALAEERPQKKRGFEDKASQVIRLKKRQAVQDTDVILSKEERRKARRLRKWGANRENHHNEEADVVETLRTKSSKDKRREIRRLRRLKKATKGGCNGEKFDALLPHELLSREEEKEEKRRERRK